MRTLAVAAAAVLLAGCWARAPKRSAVQSKESNEAAERVVAGLQRALRLEVWSGLADLLSPEAYEGVDAVKRRVEAAWKAQDLIALKIELSGLAKDRDVYVAQVRWTRSTVGRDKQVREEKGRSQLLLKKGEDGGFRILHLQGDPLY